MTSLDELDLFSPPEGIEVVPTPRKCRGHQWENHTVTTYTNGGLPYRSEVFVRCGRCHVIRDPIRARRGKQSRNYGNRAELEAARRYGGQKVGAAGGPVDIRGEDWNTQMKTHRRKPPVEWTTAFGKMAANGERMPRLLLRFVMGPGQPPQDFFVVRGEDWLAWHGKDEADSGWLHPGDEGYPYEEFEK